MALTNDDHTHEHQVRIDARFVREQANSAVRQFFQPITAPFQFATRTFLTRDEAEKAAKAAARAQFRRKR